MRAVLFMMRGGWIDPVRITTWKAEFILLLGSCFSQAFIPHNKEWESSQASIIYLSKCSAQMHH